MLLYQMKHGLPATNTMDNEIDSVSGLIKNRSNPFHLDLLRKIK